MTGLRRNKFNGPAKVRQRLQIIEDVLQLHLITKEDFFGAWRDPGLVEARMDAAMRLRDVGFGVKRIGEILHRDHTTISYYLNEDIRKRKTTHLRLSRFKWLGDDTRNMVIDIANAEGITPGQLLSQWVAERAQYEIEARARDARTAA